MLHSEGVELSLKVTVNKENNKVLYAEADSDFADVLLSFLTLPLGKIVRLMNNHYGNEAPVIGSLTNMYSCLTNLDATADFWTEGGKQMLLDPATSFIDECSKLKINVNDTMPAMRYFRCGNRDCSRKRSFHGMQKCGCGEYMNDVLCISAAPINDDHGGAFIKRGLSFLITDDFPMAPVDQSITQTLLNLGVTCSTDGAQQTTVALGVNDVMDLLRASLLSRTPLTDLIFHRRIEMYEMECVTAGVLASLHSTETVVVKAWLRKSNNELFLFGAGEDFVDFLLSLLVIPLGGVAWISGGMTGLRSIDNLYRSVRDFIDEKYFSAPDMKSRLMKPKLPPNYLSRNQFFSLEEEVNPRVYYFESAATGVNNPTTETNSWFPFKDSKGGESYVKSFVSFVVGNDVIVNTSSPVIREKMKSDSGIKEMKLHIGYGEALNILRKSLTSTSAISEGLANLILDKLQSYKS